MSTQETSTEKVAEPGGILLTRSKNFLRVNNQARLKQLNHVVHAQRQAAPGGGGDCNY